MRRRREDGNAKGPGVRMHGRRKNRIIFTLVWIPALLLTAAEFGGGVAGQATGNAPKDAQIEKGRQAVGQTCAACHAPILRMAAAQKQNQEQWKDTIYSMIGRGAEILPDEIEPMAAFLAATSARGPAAADAEPGGGGGRGGRGGAPAQAAVAGTDGRAILQRTCQQCHDMATATSKPPTEDWNAVIAKMTGYGVRLSSADQQNLIEYLNGLTK
jgi:cytochrome c5